MNPTTNPNQDQARSRRRFLQWSGSAAATALAAASGLVGAPARGENVATSAGSAQAEALKIGLASYSFLKFDLDHAISMTVRANLKYINLKSMHLPLTSTPEQIEAAMEKIHKAGLICHGCGVVDMRNEEQIDQAFEYAKTAGMKVIVSAPSVAMLPLIDKKIRKYDIAVGIHNHGPTDKIFPTPESAYEKIKQYDPRFGLCIDIGHTVRVGADLVKSVENCSDRLVEFHVKDVTEATANGKCIQLGRGVIQIPPFLKAVAKADFKGVLSFEYESEQNDPLPGVCECAGYTRGVLATI